MPRVLVILDREATEEEVSAVAAVFNSVGIDAEVNAGYGRKSAELLPYYVNVVTHSIPWLAGLYAGGFVGKAGVDSWDAFRDDGWRGLRTFLTSIGPARTRPKGSIEITVDGGPKIGLDVGLPDEALRELGYIDWSNLSEDDWLYWDPASMSWWVLRVEEEAPDRRREPAPRLALRGPKSDGSAQAGE